MTQKGSKVMYNQGGQDKSNVSKNNLRVVNSVRNSMIKGNQAHSMRVLIKGHKPHQMENSSMVNRNEVNAFSYISPDSQYQQVTDEHLHLSNKSRRREPQV